MSAINHQSSEKRREDQSSSSSRNARHLCMRPECALTGAEFRGLCDALRESEQRMQLMADALPVLISYVDFRERYQFNNAEYQKWFWNSSPLVSRANCAVSPWRTCLCALETEHHSGSGGRKPKL